jgi:hypothetical protein
VWWWWACLLSRSLLVVILMTLSQMYQPTATTPPMDDSLERRGVVVEFSSWQIVLGWCVRQPILATTTVRSRVNRAIFSK